MLEGANLAENDVEKSQSRNWSTLLTVNGKEYATSLFWQPLQNKDDPYTEVEEAAQSVMEGADLFCVKPGKAPQFGICISDDGYRKGMEAAAVALSTVLSDRSSFVAVFKVDNGWWYVCVRNDILLSDGDMLFLNEEDARNQFESMMAVPDWGRRIAPPEWGYPDTEYPELDKLLERGAKSKLKKIKALRGTKLLVVVVVSVSVGFYILSNIISEIFFATKPVAPKIAVPIKPKVQQQVQKPPEIKPWEKLKNSDKIMMGCQNAVVKILAILPPGWEVGPINCSQSAASTTWAKKVGRVSWIKKALEESDVPFGGVSYDDRGEVARASISYGAIETIKSPPVYMARDLKLMLVDFFQAIGQNVVLGDASLTSAEKNVYKSVTFKFSSKYKPSVWKELLTNFSGLEIKKIMYSPDTKLWDYEGAIYVL